MSYIRINALNICISCQTTQIFPVCKHWILRFSNVVWHNRITCRYCCLLVISVDQDFILPTILPTGQPFNKSVIFSPRPSSSQISQAIVSPGRSPSSVFLDPLRCYIFIWNLPIRPLSPVLIRRAIMHDVWYKSKTPSFVAIGYLFAFSMHCFCSFYYFPTPPHTHNLPAFTLRW